MIRAIDKIRSGIYLVTDGNKYTYWVEKRKWTKGCGGFRWRLSDETGWLMNGRRFKDCLKQISLWYNPN